MVSQERPASATRERLVAAAAAEFAARGFDGAKVDRIAAKARVNKAMLYYHFTNKAALYREVLRGVFATVASAVGEVRDAGGTPETQLRAFIQAVSATAISHPHFPPIWLREMAEGGRHLDDVVVQEMSAVLATLSGILQSGEAAGEFQAAHPLVVQLGIVGPLLLFAATAPIRERYRDRKPLQLPVVTHDAVLAHVQAATLAGLGSHASNTRRRRSS
jgi:TetR/AcrR family transcriptional regulator